MHLSSVRLTAIKAYIQKNKINYSQWGLNLGSLVFYSDAFLTELIWQVLIEEV